MNIKRYFYFPDAIRWVKENTTIDILPIAHSLAEFEYVPQELFSKLLNPMAYEQIKTDLVWVTENDLVTLTLPLIFIQNPRSPETASLVKVVSGDDRCVRYTNIWDTSKEVFTMTNRQFTLNTIKL